MDSITHILSAALWTEPSGQGRLSTRPGYQLWRERMAVAAAALLPDADGLLGLADMLHSQSQGWFAKYHRVATHSVGGLLLCAAVAATLAARWPRAWMLPSLRSQLGPAGDTDQPGWGRLFSLACVGVTVHFLGDWITAWGTLKLLWPLSDLDFQLGRVNSIEPFLLGLTVAGWAGQHWLLQTGRRRAAWVAVAVWLAAAAFYVWLYPHLGVKAYT